MFDGFQMAGSYTRPVPAEVINDELRQNLAMLNPVGHPVRVGSSSPLFCSLCGVGEFTDACVVVVSDPAFGLEEFVGEA